MKVHVFSPAVLCNFDRRYTDYADKSKVTIIQPMTDTLQKEVDL